MANRSDNTVSVISTATNTVVGAPIPVGTTPRGVVFTPDGTKAYVTNLGSNNVSVISTATNMVVGSPIPVGNAPEGVAVTPDGTKAYVANGNDNTVSVIDTATNMVVGSPIPIPVLPSGYAPYPFAVAVTPDGTKVYVVNHGPGFVNGTVSVISTATNMVVGSPIPVGNAPLYDAVTPDGTKVYVANYSDSNVSVISTATNMVVGSPIAGLNLPVGVVFTPDGTKAYVTNLGSNNVSVISTATNTVVGAPIPVGNSPLLVVIPSSPSIPFSTFSAKLQIAFGSTPNKDAFALESSFILSSTASNGINPPTEAVKLQVGTFTTTIPPGSFKKTGGAFTFVGVIGGVNLQALIAPTGTLRYAFLAAAERASLTGTTNPVPVMLTIGDDTGTTSVTARIIRLQAGASASP